MAARAGLNRARTPHLGQLCLRSAMSSWASVAKTAAPLAAPVVAEQVGADTKVAVVDANAIINGLRLESVADKLFTIQEVLDEVRDKQSRQFLASLPYGLEVREPDEQSVKAGRSRPSGVHAHRGLYACALST